MEVAVWAVDDVQSQHVRARMAAICATFRRECRGRPNVIAGATDSASGQHQSVMEALRELVVALAAPNADSAATALGRLGGHALLLQLLESDCENEGDGDMRELAATATELMVPLCPQFPMQAAALDAQNSCDLMRCCIEIDSAQNACGRPLTMHLRRRANVQAAERSAEIAVSNMLWSVRGVAHQGTRQVCAQMRTQALSHHLMDPPACTLTLWMQASLVLVRYLQSNPQMLPNAPVSESTPSSCCDIRPRHGRVLEVGAGLGEEIFSPTVFA